MTVATITTPVAQTLQAWRRSALWLVGPLVLIVAVPVADHFLPPDVHLAHLLIVAPAVTSAVTGPRLTALVGGLAVAALVIAGAERSVLITESVLVELAALAVLCALLTLFSLLRDRHELELLRVRSVSDATQRVVLRPLPGKVGPVSIASEYRSAEADTRIGGDLYAVARTSDSTRLVIGDVRGKGLASISDTSIMLGAFHAAAHRQSPLPQLVAYLENAVRWGLAEFSESSRAEADAEERFVTAAVVDIPDNDPVVHVISCGHPPPLLLHNSTVTALSVPDPALPLGLGGLADGPYAQTTFPFAHGDQLLLYTDGVSETRDGEGIFYPLAERAAAWADHAPAALVQKITTDLKAYAGGPLDDDMAMIVVQRNEANASSSDDAARPEPAAPTTLITAQRRPKPPDAAPDQRQMP
ncbi:MULTISPECIES: PP2C family protein-serine/threonine phosphatase [unclassified Streptomyces]|uniref:PP2C family protein-serine/threonine phosphatase n=1 Tax=unclassified Streptomyces TaxID=2593676 RepID=UPI002DDC528B|nr:PP2C family protein-serine/threonine phosphatase [Streptomyces sp. NBC_01445]WSE06714.1 serine/threonine-protein phosphatase [Streptomyces sp. NBC_01445]